MTSFLTLCSQESIVVHTVDAAVKKALSESIVQKVPTGNSAQAKDARREILAAVLWGRHTATGFDDAWKVISPQMQNTLKDLYPLSASVASTPTGGSARLLPHLPLILRRRLRHSRQSPKRHSFTLRRQEGSKLLRLEKRCMWPHQRPRVRVPVRLTLAWPRPLLRALAQERLAPAAHRLGSSGLRNPPSCHRLVISPQQCRRL